MEMLARSIFAYSTCFKLLIKSENGPVPILTWRVFGHCLCRISSGDALSRIEINWASRDVISETTFPEQVVRVPRKFTPATNGFQLKVVVCTIFGTFALYYTGN